MGLFGAILGKVAGEAIGAGAEIAKQKIADKRAADAERQRKKFEGAAFRLPKGFCEGANGKVWRAINVNENQLLLKIKVSGGKEYKQWFNIRDIEDYYEDV